MIDPDVDNEDDFLQPAIGSDLYSEYGKIEQEEYLDYSLDKFEAQLRKAKHSFRKLKADYFEEYKFFKRTVDMHFYTLKKESSLECKADYLEGWLVDFDLIREIGKRLEVREGFFDNLEKIYSRLYDFISDELE